jgi:hypothetical protein
MNERIEEFYSQVGLDFENFQRVTVKKGDMEKFAELIVRECSSICRNVGDAVWAEQQQSNIGTARTCELAIQKHFGVEE